MKGLIKQLEEGSYPKRWKASRLYALKQLAEVRDGLEAEADMIAEQGYQPARGFARKHFLANSQPVSEAPNAADLIKRCRDAGIPHEWARVDKRGDVSWDIESHDNHVKARTEDIDRRVDAFEDEVDAWEAKRNRIVGADVDAWQVSSDCGALWDESDARLVGNALALGMSPKQAQQYPPEMLAALVTKKGPDALARAGAYVQNASVDIMHSQTKAWPMLNLDGVPGMDSVAEAQSQLGGDHDRVAAHGGVVHRQDGQGRAYASASLPTPGEGGAE